MKTRPTFISVLALALGASAFAVVNQDATVAVGDVLSIASFNGESGLISRPCLIGADGDMHLPLVGKVHVSGLTVAEAVKAIQAAFVQSGRLAASPQMELVVVSTAAPATDPQSVLRAAVDGVLAIAYPEKAADPAAPAPATLAVQVRPLLEKNFSFDLLTRSAVGPGWSQIKPEDQKRLTSLFTEVIIRTYAGKFEPGERPKVIYAKPVEVSATIRELPTTITYAGKTFAVSYRMRELPEGWRIYDVNIEGVSMVSNYRAQFDPLFQKGGGAAIISALEKNIADFAATQK